MVMNMKLTSNVTFVNDPIRYVNGKDVGFLACAKFAYRTQEHRGFITHFKTHEESFDFEVFPDDDGVWQVIYMPTLASISFDADSVEDAKVKATNLIEKKWRICDRCNEFYFSAELNDFWEDTMGMPFCSAHCMEIWEAYNDEE